MKPFENNIVFGKGGTMNPRKYYEIEARVRIWLAFNITEHKALKYKAKFSKRLQFFRSFWNALH